MTALTVGDLLAVSRISNWLVLIRTKRINIRYVEMSTKLYIRDQNFTKIFIGNIFDVYPFQAKVTFKFLLLCPKIEVVSEVNG